MADGASPKSFEKSCQQEEERLRVALEGAGAGSWHWDIVSGVQEWSAQCMALVGFAPGEKGSYEKFLATVHPEDRPYVDQANRRALKNKTEYDVEYRVVLPGGRERWLASRGRAYYNQDGAPVRMEGIVFDISKRKYAEEQARLQLAALEAAANAIVITDKRGNIIWVNAEFERSTGYTREEAIGKNPRFLRSGKQDNAFYEGLWQSILAGQVWRGEIINRHKDGSLYTEEMTITPVRNDREEITHFIAVKQDITERKRAEQALRENNERFRLMVEGSEQVFFYTHDREHRFQYLSPSVEEVLGFSPQSLLGKTYDSFLVADPINAQVQQATSAALLHGAKQPPYLAVVQNQAGKKVTLEIVESPLLLDGKVIGVQGFARDVTERKNAEDQLRQAQKMEAVGQLAGGVAHDFNNLLGVMLGYAELLLEAEHPASDDRRKLIAIRNAAQRASSLTRQLLAFSRQQVLRPEVIDLNTGIAQMEKLLQRLLPENILFRFRAGRPLGHVKADPGQIDQVVMNLAINARDAMVDGGELTIETKNVDIDESYLLQHPVAKPGPFVMLAVSDTGCGMDKETQSRIFEPFFTTKELGKGTGLGLATVYGVVKQSGGFIWVYSEPGKGSTFKIYLPRVQEEPEHAETSPVEEKPACGEIILVVEDATGLRQLCVESLRSLGYTVLEAANGSEALALAEEHAGKIDLVLTDVIMPGMNGRDLGIQLKARQPRLKVIYASGYTAETIGHHGILDPGLAFLQKPFTPKDLARKVREALDGC